MVVRTDRIRIWKQTQGNIATAQHPFVLGSDVLVSQPGQPSGAAHAHIHGGIELGAVVDGPAILHANGADYELVAGDSFLVDSSVPHQMGAVSGTSFRYNYAHLSYDAVLSIRPGECGLALANRVQGGVPLFLKGEPTVGALLAEAFRLQEGKSPFDAALAWSKTVEALVLVARTRTPPAASSTGAAAGNDAVFAAVEFIHQHYRESIGATEIAKHCSLSSSRLTHLFSKKMGYSPVEYRNKIRIDHALDALLGSAVPVERIASDVGFQSLGIFYRVFKQATGKTPKQFRSGKS
ncbi:MAG: AraC family transcriptional regulator [Polyangiaceae bacterium]|nr:AraC family transcriptional regulator [Polyangiaceae bacterium]